jgi:hypothetical protein
MAPRVALPGYGVLHYFISKDLNTFFQSAIKPSGPGYNWATLFLGDINTGTWPSRLGELKLKLKLKLIYDRQSVGAHLGPFTNFSFSLKFLSDICVFVIL